MKNIGSCFGVDSKRRHNCAHLAYSSFFNIAGTLYLKKTSDEITSADGIIHLENIEPIKFSDVFQYCGKQFALCYDNKLRTCRVCRITFECEDREGASKISFWVHPRVYRQDKTQVTQIHHHLLLCPEVYLRLSLSLHGNSDVEPPPPVPT